MSVMAKFVGLISRLLNCLKNKFGDWSKNIFIICVLENYQNITIVTKENWIFHKISLFIDSYYINRFLYRLLKIETNKIPQISRNENNEFWPWCLILRSPSVRYCRYSYYILFNCTRIHIMGASIHNIFGAKLCMLFKYLYMTLYVLLTVFKFTRFII